MVQKRTGAHSLTTGHGTPGQTSTAMVKFFKTLAVIVLAATTITLGTPASAAVAQHQTTQETFFFNGGSGVESDVLRVWQDEDIFTVFVQVGDKSKTFRGKGKEFVLNLSTMGEGKQVTVLVTTKSGKTFRYFHTRD